MELQPSPMGMRETAAADSTPGSAAAASANAFESVAGDVGILIASFGKADAADDEIGGMEAGIDVGDDEGAAEKKSGAGHEEKSESDFGDDESAADAVLDAGVDGAGTLIEEIAEARGQQSEWRARGRRGNSRAARRTEQR